MPDLSIPVSDSPLNPQKRAVVVGASSGIGAAIARKLAQQGYLVALLARRKEALEALANEINGQTGLGHALAYAHNVTDFESIPILFQQLLRDLKRIDAFIYVSGIMNPTGMSEYDFEKEKEVIDVNLLGAMAWLGQAAQLFEQMGEGQIVGISSVAGDRGRVRNQAYNTSKAALDTYLEALRNRLTRRGVHVLTVKPGFVQTDMLAGAKASFGVISPEKAANSIWKAMQKRRQLIYTPGWWRWFMLIIRSIPSVIFRRLSF
jgi:short-subunit dehydrogenase